MIGCQRPQTFVVVIAVVVCSGSDGNDGLVSASSFLESAGLFVSFFLSFAKDTNVGLYWKQHFSILYKIPFTHTQTLFCSFA